eukprot:105859-Alexandrium_andersonii.AAC.1
MAARITRSATWLRSTELPSQLTESNCAAAWPTQAWAKPPGRHNATTPLATPPHEATPPRAPNHGIFGMRPPRNPLDSLWAPNRL